MKTGEFLKTGLVTGIVILVLSMAFSWIAQAVFSFNVLTLAGMRSIGDPIMALFFLHPFVLSFALVYAYDKIKKSFKGKPKDRWMHFGFLMWIVVGIPSAFMVWSSMTYPLGFTVNTVFGSLIYLLGAGWIITKMTK